MPTDADARRIDTANVRRLTMHCRRCQHEVGEFLGPRAIRLGGAIIKSRITYYCSACQRRWQWRPAQPEDVDTLDQV